MAWNDGLDNNSAAYNLAASNAQTIRAVAGPGSGKSFAIKRRILRLLEQGVPPAGILALTFTRTAAQDLKTEIASLGFEGANEVHARTVHSHALRILMQEGVLEQTGRDLRMVIDHEQKPILRDIDRDEFGGVRDKEKLLAAYLAGWARLQQDAAGFVQSPLDATFEQDLLSWFGYHGGILVGEVIPIAIGYLRNNPAVPQIGEYQYILVDEFQDLNKSEQEFIRLIRGDSPLVIVGDDDQSIYGFKHAHPQGIREVDQLFGNFDDVPFDVCRRCPTLVTRMASELISKNPHRTLGVLNHFPANPQGIVNIVQWPTYENEIQGLASFVINEIGKGVLRPEDVLILAPRRKIGYRLRDLLLAGGLSVKSYFREEVIEKPKVQRAFSLMNLLANPEDSISLRFLLGHSSTDFRKNQYSTLKSLASQHNTTIRSILDSVLKQEIPDTNIKPIIAVYRQVLIDLPALKTKILENPVDGFSVFFVNGAEDEEDFYEIDQIYRTVVEEIGVEDLADPNNFGDWFPKVMRKVLETIALPDSPDSVDHIRIMSLHSSKGLSAKLVILASMIDPLMPFIGNGIELDQIDHVVQEARRLFYVAITRCKASNDYEGRLVISSFLSIPGVEALRMGISANPRGDLRTRTTRFVNDFGTVSPQPIRGNQLV